MRMPSRRSGSAVRAPTPHSAVTGSGCRKSSTSAAGTTSMPSGLHRAEATLATNFVGATPTEQVSASSRRPAARMRCAITAGPALGAHGAGDVEERLVERERLGRAA